MLLGRVQISCLFFFFKKDLQEQNFIRQKRASQGKQVVKILELRFLFPIREAHIKYFMHQSFILISLLVFEPRVQLETTQTAHRDIEWTGDNKNLSCVIHCADVDITVIAKCLSTTLTKDCHSNGHLWQIYTKFGKMQEKVTAVQPQEESHWHITSAEQDALKSISITSLKQSSPLKYWSELGIWKLCCQICIYRETISWRETLS